MEPANLMMSISYLDQCPAPCLITETTMTVKSEGSTSKQGATFIHLQFNTEVVKSRNVLNYNLYNFLIDVGSSLGLWLGLSVLSFADALAHISMRVRG